MKVVLITGITGQDGSYLAELLLSKEYEVHGIVRHIANINEDRYYRIKHLLDKIHIHFASVEDYPALLEIVQKVKPDECYHLASQSFVADSFKYEFSTLSTNINGTHNMLSIIHQVCPKCKFYFAGSSEMFGKVNDYEDFQNEDTPFNPVSPYAISKVAGFDLTKYYRNSFNMFAVGGILFNHESPRRGSQFISKKIVAAVVNISQKFQKELRVGNIDARRDWGYAPDYVKAMWLMMQKDEPSDYVIATGKSYSVRDFLEIAFSIAKLNYEDYIVIDKDLYRPVDVNYLCGNASKARKELAWKPEVNFSKLVQIMLEYEGLYNL